MSELEQPVIDFFLTFQQGVNDRDGAAITAAFGPELLLGSPGSTRAMRNDAALRARVEEWLGWLTSAGVRDVKALDIDPLRLGSEYVLARVRWSIWSAPSGRNDFVDEFLVDYVVQVADGRHAIVATFSHDTDAELRRRLGLDR